MRPLIYGSCYRPVAIDFGAPCAKMPSRGSESMACEPCGALFAKEAYGGMLKHHKPIWRENTHSHTRFTKELIVRVLTLSTSILKHSKLVWSEFVGL